MPAIRSAIAIFEHLGFLQIGITETGLGAWLGAVIDAMRPRVIAANVDAASCTSLNAEEHAVIVGCPICLTRSDAPEVHTLGAVLKHQRAAIIRIPGRGACCASIPAVRNGAPIEEALPVRVENTWNEDGFVQLPRGPKPRHVVPDVTRRNEKIIGDLSLNAEIPLLNSGHLNIETARILIRSERCWCS